MTLGHGGVSLDKEQTKELSAALKLIIVGIFFWILKPRLITRFFLPADNFFNIFGIEILGTILVLIGVMIIFRSYPFAYSLISSLYIIFIFLINVLEFFMYDNFGYRMFQSYTPFFTSIMLFFVSKLMQDALRHFGSTELARKWSGFAIIIIFGFTIPNYTWLTLKNLGYINFTGIDINGKIFISMLPVLIVVIFCMIYYSYYLIRSFNYLSGIQKKYNKKAQAAVKS